MILRSLLLLALVLPASCKWHRDEDDPFHLTFHIQASGAESPGLVFQETIPGIRKEVYFRTVPEFDARYVTGFYPFKEEEDQSGYGAVFELNRAGAQRLLSTSAANIGSYMVVKVDGRTVERLYIEEPVRDGIVVVWSGIPAPTLDLFEDKMVRLRSQPAGIGTFDDSDVNLDAQGYGGWSPMRR